jgi:hypothetical protein
LPRPWRLSRRRHPLGGWPLRRRTCQAPLPRVLRWRSRRQVATSLIRATSGRRFCRAPDRGIGEGMPGCGRFPVPQARPNSPALIAAVNARQSSGVKDSTGPAGSLGSRTATTPGRLSGRRLGQAGVPAAPEPRFPAGPDANRNVQVSPEDSLSWLAIRLRDLLPVRADGRRLHPQARLPSLPGPDQRALAATPWG